MAVDQRWAGSRVRIWLATSAGPAPFGFRRAAPSTGKLDLAVLRAGHEVPGLRALPLWDEPVWVALSASHPLAAEPELDLAWLTGMPVRLPGESCDPMVHAYTVGACRRAGFEPETGRPIGRLEDVLVEIGAGASAWTPLFGSADPGAVPSGVAVRPLVPALTVPGSLVTSDTRSSACVRLLQDAFTA